MSTEVIKVIAMLVWLSVTAYGIAAVLAQGQDYRANHWGQMLPAGD